MPTTPNGRWSPDGTDGVDGLIADLAMMQTTNEAADNVTRGLITAPTAANQAARDLIYPSPVQGNRVFRADLGVEEVFYGAYNASTNPGGATPQGWYPIAGMMPRFAVTKSGNTSTASGAWVENNWFNPSVIESRGGFSVLTESPTRILVPYRGWYDVTFWANWADAAPNGARFPRITSDGTAPFNSAADVDRKNVAPAATSSRVFTASVHAATYISTGQYQDTGAALNITNPSILIQYRYPSL